MKNKITLIKQMDKYGCGIACAAMVLGKTYEEVRKVFGTNLEHHRIDDDIIIKYISNQGYDVLLKQTNYWTHKDIGREELLKPFMDIHLIKISLNADSSCEHWVVMDNKGKFYCPMNRTQEEIKNCYQVWKCYGLRKVV